MRDARGNVAEKLGARVFELMARDLVSAAALAEDANVAPGTIRQILNGKSNVTISTLTSIADALGCRLVIEFEEVDT
jgi:transcriptional regulator with XRE-family HTH domain